jgi:hypothetical protein
LAPQNTKPYIEYVTSDEDEIVSQVPSKQKKHNNTLSFKINELKKMELEIFITKRKNEEEDDAITRCMAEETFKFTLENMENAHSAKTIYTTLNHIQMKKFIKFVNKNEYKSLHSSESIPKQTNFSYVN